MPTDLLNEKCIVNHSCYFGATNNNYTEFDKLDKHRVCGIKLFMGPVPVICWWIKEQPAEYIQRYGDMPLPPIAKIRKQ